MKQTVTSVLFKQQLKRQRHASRAKKLRKATGGRRQVRKVEDFKGALDERVEPELLEMRRHLEVGREMADYWNALNVRIGGGIPVSTIMPSLHYFRTKVDRLLKAVMFNKNANCSLVNDKVRLITATLGDFAGQVMVLPLSLITFTNAKARDCRVVLDYGNKLTTIDGSQFNGKCSRIPIELHPNSTPRASLVWRKKIMGVFVKEKIIGQWNHSQLSRNAEEPQRVVIELIFTEDRIGETALTGRASFQLEWFPKPLLSLRL